jgi:hypothetical protein
MAPATIARTTIEVIGSDRAQHSVKMRLPSSGNTLWLIANTVLIVMYHNLIQTQTSSRHQDGQQNSTKVVSRLSLAML